MYIGFSKFDDCDFQIKHITNEDDNLIPLCSMIIILLIFMSDIFFCICLMRDAFPLLSTILYDL